VDSTPKLRRIVHHKDQLPKFHQNMMKNQESQQEQPTENEESIVEVPTTLYSPSERYFTVNK